MEAGSPLAGVAAGYKPPSERIPWRIQSRISRAELFAGLLIIPCVNGLAGRAIEAVRELGWHALTAGFNVSAIVWFAVFASLRLVLRTGEGQVKASMWWLAWPSWPLQPCPFLRLAGSRSHSRPFT